MAKIPETIENKREIQPKQKFGTFQNCAKGDAMAQSADGGTKNMAQSRPGFFFNFELAEPHNPVVRQPLQKS
jgi:hypothetical protein